MHFIISFRSSAINNKLIKNLEILFKLKLILQLSHIYKLAYSSIYQFAQINELNLME